MPWNIRPALLVLWGVCWMFYYGPNASQPEQQYVLKDYVLEDTTIFDDGFDSNFDPSWAPLIGSSDPLVNTYPDIPFPTSTSLNHIPVISTFRTWIPTSTGIPGSLANEQFLDSFDFQALEPVAQQHIQYGSTFGDALQSSLQQEVTSTVLPVDDILRSSTYRGTVISAGQPSETTKITDSTISTSVHGIVVADEPPRNPAGDIICDRAGCANAIFAQKSAWKIHMDRQHNRPYRCEEQGCTNSRSYGSKGELKRHVDRVHKQIQHPCPVAGCSYACSRKDNLRDHVKRQHRNEFSTQAPILQGTRSSSSAERIDVVATSVEHVAPTAEEGLHVLKARKCRRGSGSSSSPSRTGSQSEDQHDLVEENKRLRRENEGLKRELELAKKRESTFFTLFDASRRNPE
ncbi:hypothetical protein IQ07DRAFT_648893 [Pyrenochaeta sp. DS3sAY3a]|nr:hypothetical protein IQ07DRAFT_648893 [Pyrenochaeta sp. DS3sAY3a]